MTAAARSLLHGSPEPLPVWVDVHDVHGRALFHVSARTRKSAWEMVVDAPQYERAEVVYFDERGVKSRVYRDASSRQWRST